MGGWVGGWVGGWGVRVTEGPLLNLFRFPCDPLTLCPSPGPRVRVRTASPIAGCKRWRRRPARSVSRAGPVVLGFPRPQPRPPRRRAAHTASGALQQPWARSRGGTQVGREGSSGRGAMCFCPTFSNLLLREAFPVFSVVVFVCFPVCVGGWAWTSTRAGGSRVVVGGGVGCAPFAELVV